MKFKSHPRGLVSALLAGTIVLSSFGTSAFASSNVKTAASLLAGQPTGEVEVCPAVEESAAKKIAANAAQFRSVSAAIHSVGEFKKAGEPEPVSLMLDTSADTYLIEGEDQKVHLRQLYSDGSTVDVTKFATWTTYDESIATITKIDVPTTTDAVYTDAIVHAVSAGDTVITATYNDVPSVSFITSIAPKPLPDETRDILLSMDRAKMRIGSVIHMQAVRENISDMKSDVTTKGEWSSRNPDIASVTADGIIEAKALGRTYIDFKYEDLDYTVLIDVVNITGVVLNERSVEVLPNDNVAITASVTLSDGSNSDVTSMATWEIKDPEIATVASGVIYGLSVGTTTLKISYDSKTDEIPLTVTNNPKSPVLLGLDISKPNYTLEQGQKSEPMTVIGVYSNGTTEDVTDLVTWNTGNDLVSVQDHSIYAATGGSGGSLIMATYLNRMAYVPVYVKPLGPNEDNPPIETHPYTSLEVTPEVSSMQVDQTLDLKVVEIYNYGQDPSKNMNVTDLAMYTSLNPDIVSVSNTGQLTALSEGTATITIKVFGFTKRLTINVTNGLTTSASNVISFKHTTDLVPSESKVTLNTAEGAYAMTAKASYSDGSTEDVTKASLWTSLNPNIVKVQDGVLTPVHSGTTQVLVHDGNASTWVEVAVGTEDEPSLSGDSKVVAFYHPAEVIVQQRGLIPIRLQALLNDGRLVDLTDLTNGNPEAGLEATAWNTADGTIAEAHQGKVRGLTLGETKVLVQYGSYPIIEIPAKVQSTPGPVTLVGIWVDDLNLRMLDVEQYEPAHHAFAEYSNHIIAEVNDDGYWCTTEPAIATVDTHGNITSHGWGAAYVKFIYDDPIQATPLNDQIWVRVNNSVTLGSETPNVELSAHNSFALTVYALFSDDRRNPIYLEDAADWQSSDESVVVVNDLGVIYAQAPGEATITVSYLNQSLEIPVTVYDGGLNPDPAPILSTFATPGYAIQTVGGTIKPNIYTMFADGSVRDVTSEVQWLESSAEVASVLGGTIKANAVGASVILASYHGDSVIIPVVVQGGASGGVTPPQGQMPSQSPVSSNAPTPSAAPTAEPGKLSLIDGVDISKLTATIKQALANTAPVSYTDLPSNSWSAYAVTLASHIGLVKGYSDGSFRPKADVTRAEFATMLARALGLSGQKGISFSDVSSTSFAADAISTLQAKGLINGYGDGTFKPNRVISRAEIATILAKVTQLANSAAAGKFTDVTGHWAADAINALAEQGIIQGKGENQFAPDASATREESVVLILRMIGAALELDLKL